MPGFLFILSGLPGVGKTSFARAFCERVGAAHLRVDTIEQTLRDQGQEVTTQGYNLAFAIAQDMLKSGTMIVADSVNPLHATREGWRRTAEEADVGRLQIEIVCSDKAKHRERVENRTSDIDGLTLPVWEDVLRRKYEAWAQGEAVTIDAAHRSATDLAQALAKTLKL
ncbi:MAG: hypothetical protein CMK09_02925 [Ponticaulis sp.]|nr:hypothetical protein [Ponticaulis sp.]|tara:strand:+ start:6882 stop:7385 length:504 start_codon:yes stop_codon:yes gene_type:complete